MHPHPYELELVNFSIRQNHRDALNQHQAHMVQQHRREGGRISALRARIMARLAGIIHNADPKLDPHQSGGIGFAPPE